MHIPKKCLIVGQPSQKQPGEHHEPGGQERENPVDKERIDLEDLKRVQAEVLSEKEKENALLKRQLEEARQLLAMRDQPGM